jgi:hypothetical protein
MKKKKKNNFWKKRETALQKNSLKHLKILKKLRILTYSEKRHLQKSASRKKD